MYTTTRRLRLQPVLTREGRLGHVADVLFDDETWRVRWIVVDADADLAEPLLLLDPAELGQPRDGAEGIRLRMGREEALRHRDIDADPPFYRLKDREFTSRAAYWFPWGGTEP